MQDLTGKTFGRYTVIGFDGKTAANAPKWKCICACGAIRSVVAGNLVNGHARSCGCLARERTSEAKRVHGMCKSVEYRAWYSMKTRCYNRNNPSYINYGARGIIVCERWRSSFETFYADMGPRPSPKHSLDRIDNNGPYSPDNCRWATRKEQARNTRHNSLVRVGAENVCLVEASEKLGISADTVRARCRRGWTPQQLTSGKGPRKKRVSKGSTRSVWVTYAGATRTLTEWASLLGIKATTLAYRIAHWPLERAFTARIQRCYCDTVLPLAVDTMPKSDGGVAATPKPSPASTVDCAAT
jgi:hypothetical protein